jgi:hypothetical protein
MLAFIIVMLSMGVIRGVALLGSSNEGSEVIASLIWIAGFVLAIVFAANLY